MSVNPQQELVWLGRLHLGDEPGVYGNSSYCGLTAELPLSVYRLDPAQTNVSTFKLVLETEALQTFNGYPGHEITVIIYEPAPSQTLRSIERILVSDRFTGSDNNRKEVEVDIGQLVGPFRISVRLRCDTTVNPGLYDDFVWLKLSLAAQNFAFYASFGFPS